MTTNDLEHYINSIEKAVAGSERVDSCCERSSYVGYMPLEAMAFDRDIFYERKSLPL